MIEVIFIPVFLYLIGSLPTSYLFAKYFLKKNILLEGTKHSGLSNIYSYITFDKVIYILFLDVIIKGALPSFLLQIYFQDYFYFLFFLIMGHNWSIFLSFRGGKGLAISIGIIILAVSLTVSTLDTLINGISSLVAVDGSKLNKKLKFKLYLLLFYIFSLDKTIPNY